MNINQLTSMTMPFHSSTVTRAFGGYSFNKNIVGRRPGQTSFNGQATSMIKAYFLKTAHAETVFNGTRYAQKNKRTNKRCFISEPTFSHTNTIVNIQVFYYMPNLFSVGYPSNTNKTKAENNEYVKLSTILAQLYEKEVNLVLTRVHYPYMNSSIFSQYLVHNAPSNTFIQFQEAILTYPSIHCTSLPAHISGIKVQVSGRLVTETVVPRVTVKSALIGSFNANTPSALIDYSKFTSKNELGAFTVKVWISQRKGNDI